MVILSYYENHTKILRKPINFVADHKLFPLSSEDRIQVSKCGKQNAGKRLQ